MPAILAEPTVPAALEVAAFSVKRVEESMEKDSYIYTPAQKPSISRRFWSPDHNQVGTTPPPSLPTQTLLRPTSPTSPTYGSSNSSRASLNGLQQRTTPDHSMATTAFNEPSPVTSHHSANGPVFTSPTNNLPNGAPNGVMLPRAQPRRRPNSYSEYSVHQKFGSIRPVRSQTSADVISQSESAIAPSIFGPSHGFKDKVDITRIPDRNVSLPNRQVAPEEFEISTDPGDSRNNPQSSTQSYSGQVGPQAAHLQRRRTTKRSDTVKIGTTIDKNHKNYILMYNMLTGIRIGVSRCESKPRREISAEDYTAAHKLAFDVTGNELNPTSDYDFKFKDYAPFAFRCLREYFKIKKSDYLQSLVGRYVLSEIGSPGKSGSFFYFSHDYRFIIKTIHHKEQKLLLKVLPQYLEHVRNNPNTLLSRFFGLHRVKEPGGKKIHFVVMSNIFPPNKDIHETFDLKGSTVGRTVSPEELNNPQAVLKDLNWLEKNRKIELGPIKRAALSSQLERDVELLKDLNIMDYSLLIGVHDLSRGNVDNLRDTMLSVFEPSSEIARQKSQKRRMHDKAAAMKQALTQGDLAEINPSDLPRGPFRERQTCIFYADDGGFRSTDENDMPLRELYYMGVIDILTPYNGAKRFEHFVKAVGNSRKGISAISPIKYGDRFLKFMKGITKFAGEKAGDVLST